MGSNFQPLTAEIVGLLSLRLLLDKTSTLLVLPLGSTVNRTMTLPAFKAVSTLRGMVGCA